MKPAKQFTMIPWLREEFEKLFAGMGCASCDESDKTTGMIATGCAAETLSFSVSNREILGYETLQVTFATCDMEYDQFGTPCQFSMQVLAYNVESTCMLLQLARFRAIIGEAFQAEDKITIIKQLSAHDVVDLVSRGVLRPIPAPLI